MGSITTTGHTGLVNEQNGIPEKSDPENVPPPRKRS
jgi:hypothetical protein